MSIRVYSRFKFFVFFVFFVVAKNHPFSAHFHPPPFPKIPTQTAVYSLKSPVSSLF